MPFFSPCGDQSYFYGLFDSVILLLSIKSTWRHMWHLCKCKFPLYVCTMDSCFAQVIAYHSLNELDQTNEKMESQKLMGDIFNICPLFPFNTSSYLVSSYSSNLLPYHLMILWVCAKYLLESWGWVQFSVLTRKDIVSCCFPCFPSPQLKRKKLSPYMCSWRRVQGGQIHLHNYPLHRV